MLELCSTCNEPLSPVYIKQTRMATTGSKESRLCCSHLLCEYCGEKVITDGEYLSGPWMSTIDFEK